nr:MFS transporter [Paenibacillus gorillae]
MYIVPYTTAGILAVISGIIVNKLGIKRTLLISAATIIVGLMIAGFCSAESVSYVIAALTLITVGYAFAYGPLFTGAISTLNQNEMGTGIGLFNFTCYLSNALGISLSGILLNSNISKTIHIFNVNEKLGVYTNAFLFFAITALIGTIVYYVSTRKQVKLEAE